MEFSGVLPPDAPDPRHRRAELAERMPVPPVRLVAQPALTDETIGISTSEDAAGLSRMDVSFGATLWRRPGERDDPVNLAELDDVTRRAIEEEPPWPRPPWLVAQVQLLRYPRLWEAVRTSWHRDTARRPSVEEELLDHTTHILVNRFGEQLGLGFPPAHTSPAFPTARSIRRDVPVEIDGAEVAGMQLDTDPFVYAIGAEPPTGGILTVVIERDHLPFVDLRFTTA